MKSTKSCGMVIYRNEAGKRLYLVIHDVRNRKWGFPKGHKVGEESDIDAAHREVHEEIGLKPQNVTSYSITINFINTKNVERTVVYFIGEVFEENVILQHGEIVSHKWLPYDEALDQINFDKFKEVLVQAEEYLNKEEK